MINIIKRLEFGYLVMMRFDHNTVSNLTLTKNRQPLKPEEVLQDISQEHVNKTVTIANHPHTNIPQAYIHPCRHASVMKKLIGKMMESGKEPRVDQYP
jgi:ubiquitin-like-conjugating enzyme ATG3